MCSELEQRHLKTNHLKMSTETANVDWRKKNSICNWKKNDGITSLIIKSKKWKVGKANFSEHTQSKQTYPLCPLDVPLQMFATNTTMSQVCVLRREKNLTWCCPSDCCNETDYIYCRYWLVYFYLSITICLWVWISSLVLQCVFLLRASIWASD